MRKKENENEFSSVFQQDFIRYDGKEKARVFKENETIVAIRLDKGIRRPFKCACLGCPTWSLAMDLGKTK